MVCVTICTYIVAFTYVRSNRNMPLIRLYNLILRHHVCDLPRGLIQIVHAFLTCHMYVCMLFMSLSTNIYYAFSVSLMKRAVQGVTISPPSQLRYIRNQICVCMVCIICM